MLEARYSILILFAKANTGFITQTCFSYREEYQIIYDGMEKGVIPRVVHNTSSRTNANVLEQCSESIAQISCCFSTNHYIG